MGAADEYTIPFVGLTIKRLRITIERFRHEHRDVLVVLGAVPGDQACVRATGAWSTADIQIELLEAAEELAALAVVLELGRGQLIDVVGDHVIVGR